MTGVESFHDADSLCPMEWSHPPEQIAALQKTIAEDPEAIRRVFSYLRGLGVEHSGQISGATLAAVCGVDSRTWRRWIGAERAMPEPAWRLLVLVSGVTPSAPGVRRQARSATMNTSKYKTYMIYGDMMSDSAADQYPEVTLCDACVEQDKREEGARVVQCTRGYDPIYGEACHFCGG